MHTSHKDTRANARPNKIFKGVFPGFSTLFCPSLSSSTVLEQFYLKTLVHQVLCDHTFLLRDRVATSLICESNFHDPISLFDHFSLSAVLATYLFVLSFNETLRIFRSILRRHTGAIFLLFS